MKNEKSQLFINCVSMLNDFFNDKETLIAEIAKDPSTKECEVFRNVATLISNASTGIKSKVTINPKYSKGSLDLDKDYQKLKEEQCCSNPELALLDDILDDKDSDISLENIKSNLKTIFADKFVYNGIWAQKIDDLITTINLKKVKKSADLPEIVQALKEDLILSYVGELKYGKTLELPESIINEITEYLFKSGINFSLYIEDNKVKLELK